MIENSFFLGGFSNECFQRSLLWVDFQQVSFLSADSCMIQLVLTSIKKSFLGFWLRTEEKYNLADKQPTIKRTPFFKYSNFRDPTVNPATGMINNHRELSRKQTIRTESRQFGAIADEVLSERTIFGFKQTISKTLLPIPSP